MGENKTVNARQAAADIKLGFTDEQLMGKYRLSAKGLDSLKSKLVAAGLLTQSDFESKADPVQSASKPMDSGEAGSGSDTGGPAEIRAEPPTDWANRLKEVLLNLWGMVNSVVGRLFDKLLDAKVLHESQRNLFTAGFCGLVGVVLLAGAYLLAGGGANVVVVKQEFSLRHLGVHPGEAGRHTSDYLLLARGKVKNVGRKEAKRVHLGADCGECKKNTVEDAWMSAEAYLREKTKASAVIDYLAAGQEETFDFYACAYEASADSDEYRKQRPPRLPKATVKVRFE